MSMHVEWDTASEAGASIYTRETAQEEFGADITAPFALLLGGNGGGALGIEGTREELVKLAEDILSAAQELPTADRVTCSRCGSTVDFFRGLWWTGDDFQCPDGEANHAP